MNTNGSSRVRSSGVTPPHSSTNRVTEHRESMSDIAEDPTQRTPSPKPTSRRRADSLQAPSSSPPQSRQSADVQQRPDQATISAYLRSSYYDDVTERPRRFSSAERYYSSSPPAHHSSQGDIGRLSGTFNAPTHVEVERHEDHKRSSRGVGRFKNAVRGLVKA